VEIGVDRILLVTAARTVVRWDGDKLARELARLRRIAREAAMQSRRAWLADIAGPAALDEALAASAGDRRPRDSRRPGRWEGVALAHPGGLPVDSAHHAILVGPEGGWAPEELAGTVPFVSLGPTNLRTETAAVVAGTLMIALRAGLVRPPLPG
jgi:16S rRNA (uracil1498-N3)-methyltransferase